MLLVWDGEYVMEQRTKVASDNDHGGSRRAKEWLLVNKDEGTFCLVGTVLHL